MPSKSLRFCNHNGCTELISSRYCEKHDKEFQEKQKEKLAYYDKNRGSAQERGYDWRWQKYSKRFLKQPGNQICKLHFQGCTLIANCVDHIEPHNGSHDPMFWEPTNHQAACIHCNSVKGHRKIVGTYDMMGEMEKWEPETKR